MDAARRAAVATMLGARSMAVVGASPRPDSFGSRMILETQRGSARVHLVNPRYDRIGELPCAPSLADLDEPVDLVLLGVPDAALVEQLEAAASAGARSAVLFGSAHGLREQVTAIASSTGMALCGAGCMGFREQCARGARAGLPGTRSATVRRHLPGHPFRFGVLDAAAGAPWVRFPAGGLLGSGAGHRYRRLRRVRIGRSRDPDHRAVDGDTPLGPTAAAGAETRRGARCAGGLPVRRWFAAGPRDGRGAFRCAGRRGCGLAGVLRGHRGGARARSGRNDRHTRTVRRGAAGFRWRTRYCHSA